MKIAYLFFKKKSNIFSNEIILKSVCVSGKQIEFTQTTTKQNLLSHDRNETVETHELGNKLVFVHIRTNVNHFDAKFDCRDSQNGKNRKRTDNCLRKMMFSHLFYGID